MEAIEKKSTVSMQIPIKSVIMTIGPTGCGKSTFIKDKLLPALRKEYPNANIQVLSSDQHRRDLLGKEHDRHARIMQHASEGAFRVMEAKFDALTSFPIVADFIILDATFLGEKSRMDFVNRSKKAHYSVVGLCFDYKNREDYFDDNDASYHPVIGSHLKRFKKETLGEIRKRDFKAFIKIKNKRDEIDLQRDKNADLLERSTFHSDGSITQHFVIGDVHGCLEELKELLVVAGFRISDDMVLGNDNTRIVLVGDIVDKGPSVGPLIGFLTKNIDRFVIVRGNHENFLYKFLTNQIPSLPPADVMETYFDSTHKLTDEEKISFLALYEKMVPFYDTESLIVTHAPCENKFLGKVDSMSQKFQRDNKYPRSREFETVDAHIEGLHKHFGFIKEESRKGDKYHVFGHVAVSRSSLISNKLFLDTGCSSGGRLTGVFVSELTGRLGFKSVDSKQPKEKDLPVLFDFKEDRKVKFHKLDFIDKMKVLKHARNKVNFVSGTMSPCDKSEDELEPIGNAFDYFKSHGVTEVVMQKKYMGSRANMYLFPGDLSKSYMTSRNGFVIRRDGLEPLYEKMLKKLGDTWAEPDDVELIIIDGELMPWAALGKGLIEHSFVAVGKGQRSEMDLLNATGFEEALHDLEKKMKDAEYHVMAKEFKKKELIEKIGQGDYALYSSFAGFQWLPLSQRADLCDIYDRQLELYGQDGSLEFRPFMMLKIVRTDGTERDMTVENKHSNFLMVSDDEQFLVYLDDTENVNKGIEFFNRVIKEGAEGVVIKPVQPVDGVVPYMKVRNPEYLTIIYGYDHLTEPKKSRLISKKSVKNKMRASKKEWDLGLAMLKIPYAEVGEENEEYLDLCAEMLIEEKRESSLDPRL